jgi:[acyl-carrier-protein] S-malonyltransferase
VQFHVTVAPAAGNFTAADLREGDLVRAGTAVGQVENRQGAAQVTAAHTGILAEWLAHDGDPVAPGQPLARLHPSGADL